MGNSTSTYVKRIKEEDLFWMMLQSHGEKCHQDSYRKYLKEILDTQSVDPENLVR